MNNTSAGQTGLVGGIGVALIAVLDWLLNTKFGLQVPATVLAAMSAIIIWAAHQAVNRSAPSNASITPVAGQPIPPTAPQPTEGVAP